MCKENDPRSPHNPLMNILALISCKLVITACEQSPGLKVECTETELCQPTPSVPTSVPRVS